MAKRSSRKRRKARRRERGPASGDHVTAQGDHVTAQGDHVTAQGYARAREKDQAARAALAPLERGERPKAVTVGALVAAALALANVVALVAGYEPGDADRPAITILGALILALIAWGMWRARYWAVLGMQTVLAIALVGSTIALVSASNLAAVALVLAIIVPAGALFWFLIKAMARIQMPERPGAARR